MEHRPSTPLFDPVAQVALHAELVAAARTPTLRPLVLHPEPDLGPRFVGHWRRLSALPRRTRRSLQRRWKRSLAAIALLMALSQVPALAATIAVDGSTCTLVDAITAANTDAPTGGCTAGSGADTLVLAAGSTHTLTAASYLRVASTITIMGDNSTIERGAGTGGTSLLTVDATGDLTLQGLTLRGGSSYEGGGVSNDGTLTISNSTVSGNRAFVGGGVFNERGALAIITHSTVSGNRADRDYFGVCGLGGGVFNDGILTISNSTVSGNNAGTDRCLGSGGGGGVLNFGTLTLTDSTVSGNTAFGGFNEERIGEDECPGCYNPGSGGGVSGGTLTISRSLISGNTAVNSPEVGGSVVGGGFNVFGLNGASGVSGFSPGPTDIIPSGPLSTILTPLADNGGPTWTHALVVGSPAVDAVKRGCPPPSADQRGFARPADGDGDGGATCDVGAFELASQPLPNCGTAQPTRGCTVNGVANRLCQGTVRGDQIFGTHRDDIIFGLDGNDRINGLGGNDLICGGKGKDILRGKMGRDRVFGGPGDDNLQGGSGNDQLSGEGGKDWLFGDRGDDALDGGADTDKCQGGANGPAGDTAIRCEKVVGVP